MFTKKLAVSILGIILCAGICFAAEEAAVPAATPATAAIPAEPSKAFTVAFVPGVTMHPFFITMKKGVLEKAKELGVVIVCDGPDQWGSAQQIQVLENMIEKKVDLIIAAPVNKEELIPVLKKATEKGIPVITVDTNLTDDSFIVAHIASDNFGSGKIAAEVLVNKIDSKGEVMTICVPGIPTFEDRKNGFLEAIKAYPDIKMAGEPQAAENDVEAATQEIAAKYKDLKGILALVPYAEGVLKGLKAANLPGKIALVTYDAGESQVAGLRSGDISALLVQKPSEIGSTAVEYAYDYLSGQKEKIEKHKLIPFVVATQGNMDDPEISKWFYASNP